jgi:choline dehydrogenase-like flavoprotein
MDGGQWLAHLRNVLIDAPATAVFLMHWLRHRTLAARKFPSVIVYPRRPRYSLDFHAEQEPNPASRVRLSDARDELGMRRLHVDWRYTERDVHTVKASLAALAQAMRDSGVGSFDYAPEEVEHEMTRYGAYGGHHIGTARMGTDPADSVVDADCRLHELDNLYVSGAAVFPTSSQANPTLTIVAMALRLGDHLKRFS